MRPQVAGSIRRRPRAPSLKSRLVPCRLEPPPLVARPPSPVGANASVTAPGSLAIAASAPSALRPKPPTTRAIRARRPLNLGLRSPAWRRHQTGARRRRRCAAKGRSATSRRGEGRGRPRADAKRLRHIDDERLRRAAAPARDLDPARRFHLVRRGRRRAWLGDACRYVWGGRLRGAGTTSTFATAKGSPLRPSLVAEASGRRQTIARNATPMAYFSPAACAEPAARLRAGSKTERFVQFVPHCSRRLSVSNGSGSPINLARAYTQSPEAELLTASFALIVTADTSRRRIRAIHERDPTIKPTDRS